jgi:catechol 2,3-dioxygenase-like lactoylglutathione lyase family enzyme
MSVKAAIGHIGLNLSGSVESLKFWRELLGYFQFTFIQDDGNHFDASDGSCYLCIGVTAGKYRSAGYHRKRVGLNHVAFRVPSSDLVDRFAADYLAPRGIEPLYGGARAYPEYADGYYAVYFETPDRMKVEVVYEP